MENRRPTTTIKPFNQKKYHDRNKEDSSMRYGRYQNRDSSNNSSGDNRFQNREGGDRFQNRDSGDNRFQNRNSNDRFQNRDSRPRFPNRENTNSQNKDSRDFREKRDFRDARNFRDDRNARDNRAPRDNFQKPENKYVSKNPGKFTPKGRFPNKGKSVKPWQNEHRIKIVSDLQVTDGKHHGKYLQNTASPKMQPTARRVREIMFKILFRRVRAGRFLDLSAGAGIIGVEAISRGAMISTFVERSSKMISFIKKNLESCSIKEGHGEIVEMEALPFLKRMAKRRRFWDVVYFNPPSETEYADVMDYLKRGTAIKPTGVLVIEHSVETAFPEKLGSLKRWRVVVQDETALSFYEKQLA